MLGVAQVVAQSVHSEQVLVHLVLIAVVEAHQVTGKSLVKLLVLRVKDQENKVEPRRGNFIIKLEAFQNHQ